jgi:hypothetical protein
MAGALAVALAVAGCGGTASAGPAPESPPTSTATPTPTPPAEPKVTPLAPQAVGAGSDGLTVRYTDGDGSIKSLRVEDFRR